MPAILLPGEVRVKLAWCRKLLMLRRLAIGVAPTGSEATTRNLLSENSAPVVFIATSKRNKRSAVTPLLCARSPTAIRFQESGPCRQKTQCRTTPDACAGIGFHAV